MKRIFSKPAGNGETGSKQDFGSLLIVGFALYFLYLLLTVVPAGHVGVKDFFGRVSERTLSPGIHLIFPFTRVHKMSVQTRELKESTSVPTSEGLIVNLDVSLLFHVRPEAASDLYKNVGRNYEAIVVEPQLRSVIRDVTAEHESRYLYSAQRQEMAKEMHDNLKNLLARRGLEVEQILLRNIELPALITKAIEEKLQADQQAQRMKFILEREKLEAERKRVEARGIADFQGIVSRGISNQLLKWKAIEVAGELSKSSNAKIIVLGDKSGLPIILSEK